MVYRNLNETCADLDRRHIHYRFDLNEDIPWSRLNEPGLHFSDRVLTRAGINVDELKRVPDAYALFQWSAALELCASYQSFKHELLEFIDADAHHLGPVRSLLLLYQEMRKHAKLFEQYQLFLRSLQPAKLREFDKLQSRHSPTKFTRVQPTDPALRHREIWERAIVVTEFSLHLTNEIQSIATNLQPVWLQLHRCHQLELYQHLSTLGAHAQCLQVEPTNEKKLIWEFIDGHFTRLLPLQATINLVKDNFPSLRQSLLTASLKECQFYQDLRESPQFISLKDHASPEAKAPIAKPHSTPERTLDAPQSILHGAPYKHPPKPSETLVDRFINTISTGLDRGLVYIYNDGQENSETYAELFKRAKNALDFLRLNGAKKSDAIMMQISRPEDFVAVFWGALLGGMVPVPLASMMTLGRGGNETDKTKRIYELLHNPLIITDPATQKALLAKPGILGAGEIRIATAAQALSHQATVGVKLAPSGPQDTAFIQFSSGSTGSPKGVCLTHQNLIHNIVSIIEHQDGKPSDCFVSWLPLFHDMGIIGYHLLPLVLQAKQVLMHPRQFMKRPRLWLDALHRHQGTCTASPNFGLNRVLDKVTPEMVRSLDLSPMHCLLNGSEPISAQVMQDFIDLLGPAGFAPNAMSPGYGLAEGSLCISARPAHTLPEVHHIDRRSLNRKNEAIISLEPTENTIPFVEVGTAVAGVSIRIVDDSDQVVAPGIVGHVHIKGPNVTTGYFENPNLSASTFDGEWLRTGDLGMVVDNRLIITGRYKDVIFVGGQNFYSHDLEGCLAQLDWFEAGRVGVFGSSDTAAGRDLICLCGVFRSTESTLDEQITKTRQRLSETFGIRLDVIIPARPSDIPKTSSGKLQRHLMRDRFEAGDYAAELIDLRQPPSKSKTPPPSVLPKTPSEASQTALTPPEQPVQEDADSHSEKLLKILTVTWAGVLQIPPQEIDQATSFRLLGGTSLQAAEIHAEIEDKLGILISHEMLNVANTVEEMANYIKTSHPELIIPTSPLPRPVLADPGTPSATDYSRALLLEREDRLASIKSPHKQPNHEPTNETTLRNRFSPESSLAEPQEHSPLEATIQSTWGQVLGLEPSSISQTESFRSLGGTSLQAAEIHATLEEQLGGFISHEMLTEADTIQAMAAFITTNHPDLVGSI